MDYMGVDDPETKRRLYFGLLKLRETEGTGSIIPGYLIDNPKA